MVAIIGLSRAAARLAFERFGKCRRRWSASLRQDDDRTLAEATERFPPGEATVFIETARTVGRLLCMAGTGGSRAVPLALTLREEAAVRRFLKRIISTHEAPAAVGPYSQAVAVGNLLSVQGKFPWIR